MARPWTVLAAPNAFKGALAAPAAAAAMAEGVRAAAPGARVLEIPIADGGDGTAAVLCAAAGGTWHAARVPDAWGRMRTAGFALLPDGLAVVDIAAASGLGGARPGPARALAASSTGTGALCAAAREAGARRIWVALGGSACTDGGAGLLEALGARLRPSGDAVAAPGGAGLQALAGIDLGPLRALADVRWSALVDVRNPLLGSRGAAAVFAPQKGAGQAEVAALEAGLAHWADLLERAAGRRARDLPGAGAAGGCGFALAAALDAELLPGAAAVCRAAGLVEHLGATDALLTGEGALDAQTAMGKAPWEAARLAEEAGVPAVALAGALGPGWDGLLRPGGPLTAALALAPGPRTRAAALRGTAQDLRRTAEAAARLLRAGGAR